MLDFSLHEAIESAKQTLHLSDSELAYLLSVSPRTLRRWRSGAKKARRETCAHLAALAALVEHLVETFSTPEAIDLWLRTSNLLLAGATPAEAIRGGRFTSVDNTLNALDAGLFI